MKTLPKTDIEYLTHHWPVVTGCSFGCPWCWARKNAAMRPACHAGKGTGLAGDERPFCDPILHPDRLDLPLRRKRPARIGVCFTGDLFGPEVPDKFIVDVFEHMGTDILQPCRQHTYLVLTKRAQRMREFFAKHTARGAEPWPNLWLGVSVTNQADADERIPLLLATPAAKRWVSIEPCFSDIDLRPYLGYSPQKTLGLDFVVVGSIDRPTAQYPAPRREWIDGIVEQCKSASVPVWVKNNVTRTVADWSHLWPQELPA